MLLKSWLTLVYRNFIFYAWDGNGAFSRTNGTQTGATTWQDAEAAGTDIVSDEHDTHDEDLATGIEACLTKNNESKPTATFEPNADASYDLGSSSLKWRKLYLSGGTVGTTTNDNAAAGIVGEVQRAVVGVGSPATIATTGTFQNLTTLSLTAGDWDVTGVVCWLLNGSTVTASTMALSAYSANTTTDHQYGDNVAEVGPPTAAVSIVASIPNWRVSVAGTTTIYLKATNTFSAGNPQAGGRISARRVR